MHASTSFIFAIGALCASVSAFHVESGTKCAKVGVACSYVSNDSSAGGSATTTVTGTCGTDLLCASNGATCSDDAQCYNYCGTDGICGGVGAGCNTQDTFTAGQTGIACASGYQCSENGSTGQCLAAAATTTTTKIAATGTSPALGASAKARRHRRRQPTFEHRQVRAADLRKRE